MRIRHKPWAKDMIAQHPEIIIPAPEENKGRWRNLFGKEAPLEIEIGTGKGQFITAMAERHPDRLFIGIEREESVIVSALKKLLERPLANARLLYVNAKDLTDYFAEGEVDAIYLNFSDPWPKKRHEKRRLTYHTFLENYKKVLKPGGRIELRTDNQGFFEYSIANMSRFGMVIDKVSLDWHASADFDGITTEYEDKFSEKGQKIYRLEASFR